MSEGGRRNAVAGIAYMVLGVSLLPVMNTLAKSLAADYPVTQIVWARFLGHLIWMALFFGPTLGAALLRARRPREMLGRSLVFFASNCVFIAALPFIQLATASAIMFTTPLIVVALSAPLLKERVGPWRSVAVVIGFCGALVIIRPGASVFQPAALLILASAACFGAYQLWTRRLAPHERPETLIIYTALVGAVVMSVIAPWSSRPPDNLADAVKFAAVGLIGGAAQYFIIRALQRAPASVVSPIGYAELAGAAAFGYFIFGDIPDRFTWLGAALIVSSGLVVVYRESIRRQRHETSGQASPNRRPPRAPAQRTRPALEPGGDTVLRHPRRPAIVGRQALRHAKYLSLETLRKSGVGVATPVWFAEQDDVFYIFCAGAAGKVKRLRNSARSRIAACTATGRRTDAWLDTEASLLTAPAEMERALAALRRKYGWRMRLMDFASRLSGKMRQRVYIAVRLRAGTAAN